MLCKFTYSGLINILVQAQVMILWGFLDTLTKFLSTVRVWIGSIVEMFIFKINIFKIGPFIYPSRCILCNFIHLRHNYIHLRLRMARIDPSRQGSMDEPQEEIGVLRNK